MANSIFKVNEKTLEFVKAYIKEMDEDACYLHGDGNLYDNKEASDFRKNFSNPGPSNNNIPPAKYRIKFVSVSQVPGSLEELEKMFYDSKQKEDAAEAKAESTTASKVKTFTLPKKEGAAEPAAGGVKSQAQLDEEQLNAEIALEAEKKKAAGTV